MKVLKHQVRSLEKTGAFPLSERGHLPVRRGAFGNYANAECHNARERKWETRVLAAARASHVVSGEEFEETSLEEGPHTGLKGIPGEVARGSDPTSTSRSPKFGGIGGVNSLMEGGKEEEPR